MVRKTLSFALAAAMVVAPVAGCANGGGSSSASESTASAEKKETFFIDDQALGIIARGFEARQELAAGQEASGAAISSAELHKLVDAELAEDTKLRHAQFSDAKLQEACLSYVNSLDAQIEVLENYTQDSLDFYTKWQDAYNNRTKILKTLVNDFGLKVSEKWQASLDELVANGGVAEKQDAAKEALNGLISAATWEKSESYGFFTYTAVIENTTEYNYKDVGLLLSLYDADDVKTEAYANTATWSSGDKVKFEAFGNGVDAQRVEAVVQYYSLG